MGKKVKVVYDVERKEAKKKNKRNRKKSPKVVPWIIFVLCEALYYYLVTPPINIQSTGFWMWLIISLLIVIVLIPDYSLYDMKNFKVGKFFKTEKEMDEKAINLLKVFDLDNEKDYKIYDEENRVVKTQKGSELYSHYDKVEASVRERYEQIQKMDKVQKKPER